MEIRNLIPTDKFDCSGIEQLKIIDLRDVEPILYELLTWIQDLNWLVAKELITVLPRFHQALVPHIKAVLNSDDDIWKCWTLLLLKDFPSDSLKVLSVEIKRIAEQPTQSELLEEANHYALKLYLYM